MKLGTKLTLYLSLIIIVVLSGYGYLRTLSRRDILVKKMKGEVRSIGRTLKVSFEKISLPGNMDHVQDLIEAVDDYERTLGVIVYQQGKELIFRSHSLRQGIEPFLDLIKTSIKEDRSLEEFGTYAEVPVFSYNFPLKDRRGKSIGGVSVIQHTSFMKEDFEKDKWIIFITIFVLIGGTLALILVGTRRWITRPIARLTEGIKNMAKGDLDTRIELKRGDELSELAQAFNQMAVDLKKAHEKIIQESETRLELERSLRQSEKLATVGQLSSGLAHEIGTPLNIISGRAELTKRKPNEKGEVQKNQEVILQQTERITKIIQQLLGFVRKKKPEQKTLNIQGLLRTTLDFIDHQVQKKGVEVVIDIPVNVPPIIGDGDHLQQVFLNLFLNAIQAMPDGGTLRLSASSKRISKEGLDEREYVEISVKDTGIGMEREILQNIFNPFFTTKDTGTGLGLMVSHGIVQDHEGWIEVESEVGRGSAFRVFLPTTQGIGK
ncbi:MAG TPA: ATP-binding protein [Thermodesulfobacteriota bacterium]|nr:ATP-binding protein [Thermodesulfobacteriota bacterium]